MPGLLDRMARDPWIQMGTGMTGAPGGNNLQRFNSGIQQGLLNRQQQLHYDAIAQQQGYEQQRQAEADWRAQQEFAQQQDTYARQREEAARARAQQVLQEYHGNKAIDLLPEAEQARARALGGSEYFKQLMKNQTDTKTADIRNYEMARQDPEFQKFLNATGGGQDTHKDILRFKAFQQMSGPEQEAFMRLQRATPWIDQGGSYVQQNPLNPGQTAATIVKDLPPEAQPSTKQAQAAAAQIGAASGTAAAQLPVRGQQVAKVRELVNELRNHPGKAAAIGGIWDAYAPGMPGSAKADFLTRMEQIHGGAFLAAREQLKGAGQVTDFESQKAESAYLRMKRSQNEKDFDAALDDFVTAVEDGYKTLEAVAKLTPAPGSAAAPLSNGVIKVERID